MGLFDKKYCDICGNQIKLLGNRKVEDGNICKDCNNKLSPWFSDRKRSTVADIKAQLAYRENNRQQLNSFRPDVKFGDKVYVDTAARKFVVARTSDYLRENADLIQLSDVISVEGSIDEDSHEETYEDEQGNDKSYEPPKFTYSYDFYVTIKVVNKYFDDMKFKLNGSEIETQTDPRFAEYKEMINNISLTLTGKECHVESTIVEGVTTEQGEQLAEGEWFCPQCGTKNKENFCSKCGAAKPVNNLVAFCPNCGTKIPDASTRFCPHCGKSLY